MSSGKIHKKYNNVFTVVATGGALIGGGFELAFPIFIGCIAGTVCTPDMDVDANLPSSFLTKLPVIRIIWKGIWKPYQKMMKHRSFWSHFPFVGTTGRILYLGFWIMFFVWILYTLGFAISPEGVLLFILDNEVFFVVVYLFWCAQDFIHWVLDL